MRGPEGDFWKRVRRAWRGHSVRIEASDGEVEVGTPDVVLSVGGRGGFIELKVWPDDVSAEQLAWHADALDRGAYAMVLAWTPQAYDPESGGTVFLGTASEWHSVITEGVWLVNRLTSLHQALTVIESALIGRSKSYGVERRSTKGRTRGAT